MTKRKQSQSFIEGALILTVAVAIVKIIGAVYKVTLIPIIDEDGYGYYLTAYNLYTTIYSIAVSGFPVAISRIVSGYMAEGRYIDVRRVKRVSTVFFAVLGIAGSALLFAFARPYVNLMNNAPAYYSILAVAPSLLFSCLMATHRGYNQGMSNMTPTAISQVVEVIFKVSTGLVFSYYMKVRFTAEFAASGTVMGTAMANESEANVTILSLAAAGAIFGVTLSVLAGWVYLAIRGRAKGDSITREMINASPRPFSKKHALKRIIAIGIPIALSSVAVTITSLIDEATVRSRLIQVLATDGTTLFASHGGLLQAAGKTLDTAPENVANYLYAVYGLAITVFNLIPTITGSFGMSALPHVTSSWIKQDRVGLKKNIESTLRITSLIAMPAGFGMAALAGPIMRLLYSSNQTGAEMATPMMTILGVAAIFVALVGPINAMLQAIGRMWAPIILMAIGGVLKVATNYLLIGIPELNIKAAPAGNLICYFVITILSLIILVKTTGVKLNVWSILGKPMFGGVLCGAFALLGYNLASLRFSNTISTILAIVLAMVIYIIAVGLLGALDKDDMLGLPGGKKIVSVLEKLRFLR